MHLLEELDVFQYHESRALGVLIPRAENWGKRAFDYLNAARMSELESEKQEKRQ